MKQLIICLYLLFTISLSAQQKGVTPLNEPSHRDSLGATTNDNPEGTPLEQTYAVVVGISDYQDEGIPDLRFADKDAIAFANFLRSPAGGSLDEDHLKVLINDQATQAQFAGALDWLWEVAQENDRAIIYFSGHGDVEKKSLTQPGFLLCWDAPSRVYMAGGAFPLNMLQEVISTISVQNKAKVIMVADACRSGKLSGSTVGGAQITGSNLAKQYANEIKILSCQPDEYSIEGEQWGGGRGAFSYHLLDGLYGMADKDNDQAVTVREIDMYLGDHVTQEVAPQNQLPMVVGNGREKLTDILPEILAGIKEGRKGQMPLFTPTESRGIEEDVLAAADSNIVELYAAFQKAIKDKHFLEPATASADYYYKILSKEPQFERLHSSMRRNYAAALQDDAQQVMNRWLKTDLSIVTLSKKTMTDRYRPYPRYLERAAALLGSEHYMYPVLKARMHFFEGYLLSISCRNHDKEFGEKALSHFRKALKWQDELPQVYWQMSRVYGYNLLQPDSAEYYTRRAMELQPSWILPNTTMAFMFSEIYKQTDRAKPYLERANRLDSSSVLVMVNWGIYFDNREEFAKSEQLYRKIIQSDSTFLYAYINLGLVYRNTRRHEEAENHYKKGIQLDSTFAMPYDNLGVVYKDTRRYEEAETNFKKAIQLDPTYIHSYNNLGVVYKDTRRYEEAETNFKKAIQLDSAYWFPYANLGVLYQTLGKWEASVQAIEKAIQFGPPIGVFVAMLGHAYPYLPGRGIEAAKSKLDEGLAMSPDSPDVHIYMAQWYWKNNRPEQAWEYLEKGLEKGIGNEGLHPSDLQDGPSLEGLRKDPRWDELMKKYFPDQYKD